MRWTRAAIPLLLSLLLIACAWPTAAQTPTDSVPVLDTLRWSRDSVPIAWRVDSVPVIDTIGWDYSFPPPPPSAVHPHEPAGLAVIADHDFSAPIAKNWKGMAGRAGCWERNGGGGMQGGKYVVTYPVGWADGRTPATLHAMTTCQAPRAFTTVYVHLQGYTPGDLGSPMWNNGEGNKILFWHFGTGSGTPVLKCWDYVAGSIGGVRSDCSVNLDGNGRWLGARSARIIAGRPNDVECLLQLNTPGVADGSATCWVNGVQVGWTRALFRTHGAGITELWLDWTYGGGGAGVAVGQRSVWTLDAFYASGR